MKSLSPASPTDTPESISSASSEPISTATEPAASGHRALLSQLPALAELSDRLQAAIASRTEGQAGPEKEAEAVLQCIAELRPDFAAYSDYVESLPSLFAHVAALRADRASQYALAVGLSASHHA